MYGFGNSLAPANPFTDIFARQDPLPLSPPAQTTPPFTLGNISESRSAATTSPFSSGGMFDLNPPVNPSTSEIFSPSNSASVMPTKTLAPTLTHSAPLSASQGSAAVQSAPITNPFGTLPPLPEVCIGTRATTATAAAPSVRQYEIASMPAIQKAASTVRISSLVSVRNLTRGLHRPPRRKYDPNPNEHRAAFFTEKPLKAPKADTVLLPRENPRALVIKTTDQKPLRTVIADNASPFMIHSLSPAPKFRNFLFSFVIIISVLGLFYYLCPLMGWNFFVQKIQSMMLGRGLSFLLKRLGWEGGEDTPTADQDNGKTSEVSSGSITGAEDVFLQKEEWNTKGRAGESATVYDNGDDIMAVLPKLRFPDYYTEPNIQELAAKERAEPGFCSRVKDFVVGRHGCGNIKFLGETDVRGLELDALVQFNYREVFVSKKFPSHKYSITLPQSEKEG